MFDPEPYFAQVSEQIGPSLLDEWNWLLGGRVFDVFRVTAMGDLFLTDEAGRIHFLDMIDGELTLFANSVSDFETKVRDRQIRKNVLSTFIVRGLKEAGILLGPAECYSPDVPPILGGELTNDNLRPCNVLVHSSILGQLHRQR